MKRTTRYVSLSLLAGAALALALPGVAAAHGPQRGESKGLMAAEFADFDLNGDGQIMADDLQAKAQARFAEADTNGDGKLSVEEMTAQAEARMADRKDRSGGQDKARGPSAEKRAAWMIERMIDRRDSDKDGMLSLAEMSPGQGMDRLIDRFDTDDDNAISQAEFDAAQKEMFQRQDGKRGHGKRRK